MKSKYKTNLNQINYYNINSPNTDENEDDYVKETSKLSRRIKTNTNQLNSSNKNLIGITANNASDFKLKYKTEKCKFWELYKECKYGENVNCIVNTIFSAHLHTETRILKYERS